MILVIQQKVSLMIMINQFVLRFEYDGIGSRTSSNNYVKLKSTKKIDIKYKVKGNYADIEELINTTLTNNSSTIGGFNCNKPSIEVENCVFGNNIPEGARVTDVYINQFVVIDKLATARNINFFTFAYRICKRSC